MADRDIRRNGCKDSGTLLIHPPDIRNQIAGDNALPWITVCLRTGRGIDFVHRHIVEITDT